MAKSYAEILEFLSSSLILKRWPDNSSPLWERAQEFSLVLDVKGYWWVDKRTIVCGYNGTPSDIFHKRVIAIPILSSVDAACQLDVKRLRSALTARGSLAKAMLKIERGRRLWWNENRHEIEGELNERAEEAIRDIEYFIEQEPLRTDETVLTVEEHLCGVDLDTPSREILERYGLTTDATTQQIESVAKQIQQEFKDRGVQAYGSYVEALKSITERVYERKLQVWR